MLTTAKRPGPRDLRWFAVLLTPFAMLAGSVLDRRLGTPGLWFWLAAGAAPVSAVGLLKPERIRPVQRAWMIAVWPIGQAASFALLTAIFFLVITPTGFVLRACGADPAGRRWDPRRKSYWVDRPATPPDDRYFRKF